MLKVKVTIFKNENVIKETNLQTNDSTINDSVIDQWVELFNPKTLTSKSLNIIEGWDKIDFDVDGTIYSRYSSNGENNEN